MRNLCNSKEIPKIEVNQSSSNPRIRLNKEENFDENNNIIEIYIIIQ